MQLKPRLYSAKQEESINNFYSDNITVISLRPIVWKTGVSVNIAINRPATAI